MVEETQETKTLDHPQSDKILPMDEIENPGGSSAMEDAQILKYLNESVLECEERLEIEDAHFAKTLENSFQDQFENGHLPKTLENEIPDAPLFENLAKSLPDEIDGFLMEAIDVVEDRDKLQFEPIKDSSSEFLEGWSSPPRSHQAPFFIEGNPFLGIDCSQGNAYGNSKFPDFSANESEASQVLTQMWNEPQLCPVGAGLANMGNTCFLNAILQCFTHTVPLVQGLLSLKHEPSSHGGEFCVLCAVRCQIELSLGYSGRVISPSNLVDNLSYISSFFRRYQQEDAHEFLQCLLDKLDSNWSKYEGNEKDSSSSNNSLVKQIFGGRLVSQVHCCKCGHNSDTYESLIDLSLEIENVDNLESALKSFTKVESIGDTEKFTCEGCKEQVPVEKQLKVDQAPSVAALHLKRFKNDGIHIEKIDKKVEYPLELDLKPYTKGAEDGNEELKYELFGVVVHVGPSSTSGHYFCYIRTAPDTWYRFDDSKVTRVLEATALCQDAYILFYTRKGTEYFSSFFEKWKVLSEQKSPTTSPKSVLYDMDVPSTSSRPGVSLHDCEPAGNRHAAPGASSTEPSGGLIPDRFETLSRVDNQNSTRASRTSAPSSSGHFDHDEVKIDRPDFDSQFSLGKKINGETCSPSHVEKTVEIDPRTPPRSLSPDIYYDEEPAEARYLIPVDHLKVEDKTPSAKKTMDKAKNDLKRKEAVRYMSKSMPSGRRHMLMAAMMGPQSQSENSLINKKRRKQVATAVPFFDERERHSPKKRAKISPKRVLRPVVA